MKAIRISNLTKFYGKNPGIVDLNLEIEEGEIFGFIGPNGAGKSTTIRTLLNLLFPTRGHAEILGMDIVKQSKEIRNITGYVPSEVNYYGDLTVAEMLNYSASFYPHQPSKRIQSLAERFELELHKRIDQLSFGNKRKVAIIQALLHQPRVLILDEPTSGLDPLMQNVFFELLREESQHATIFFSSHALSEVQRLCNNIAIIKQGKILAIENVDKLRKNSFKTVSLEYELDNQPSLNLAGIVSNDRIGKSHKFLFNGDIKSLLQALSEHQLTNVLIEEPSLEEIFMHYYERDAG